MGSPGLPRITARTQGGADGTGSTSRNAYVALETHGALHWIARDNNESLTSTGPRTPLSLSLSEVGESWPLIRYLIDVEAVPNAHFNTDDMDAIYTAHAAMLDEVATRETAQFTGAVEALRTHAASRETLVESL